MAKGQLANPAAKRVIGRAIIQEWISIITGNPREMDAHALAGVIRGQVVSGGAHGPLEVGVITDPVHRELDDQGSPVKFIWVCIPAPEELNENWLTSSGYAVDQGGGNLVPDDTKSDNLGEAVLFGCGR